MSKIDLILHPIRFRIIGAVAGRSLTPQEIARQMPDIAQTTLYRHINTLAEANILEVVRETQVRGTVERAYSVAQGAARLNPEDIAHIGKDEHLSLFMMFLSSLIQDYRHYAESDTFEPVRVLMSKTPLHISDADLYALAGQMDALMQPYRTDDLSDPARRRYLFAGLVLPNEDADQPTGDSHDVS